MRKGFIRALAVLALLSMPFHCTKKDPAGPPRDEVKPKGSISGVVYDRANHPLKDVIVSINSDSATPAVSDANGAFTVGNVLQGTYRLQFSRRDYEDDTTWTVDLAMGQDTTLNDTVELSYSYYTLLGKVVYNGGAVPGAGVSLAGLSVSAITDAEGRYVLSRIEKGADLRVITAKTGFGFNIAGIANPVSDDTTRVADIELDQEGGKVQGVVYDTAGNPVSGAVVTAVGGGLADTSSSDGSYALSDVPTGEPGMRIMISGFSGFVGGIMGLDVSSGASLTGADIHLFTAAQMQNGMAVVGSDLFVKDTAQSVLLSVFPYADTSASIASYEWFFNGSSTADTTTSKPWLRMTKTALTAKYPTGATNLGIQVRCVNSAGEFSTPASFNVRIRAVVVRVSAQGADSTKSAYSDTVRCSNRDTVYLKPNVSAVFAGIDTIQWDFGDNTPPSITLDSVVAVWHQYRLPGSYKAVVTVKDVAGTTARDSVLIVVSDSSVTHSGSLTTESVWSPRNNPHKISGTYYVRAKLTILPGCIIQFNSAAKMIIGSSSYSETATLIAQGTETDSIWFTSSSSTPMPGVWSDLQFGSKTFSAETKLQYCAMEYAVNGVYLNGGAISMDNCSVRKTSGYGVNAQNSGYFVSFTNNEITNVDDYPIQIQAEYVRTMGTGNRFAGNQYQAIWVTGSSISTTGTWRNQGVSYVMNNDINVGNSAKPVLTIAPGCSLKFGSGVGLSVGTSYSEGGLIAEGTSDSVVVFTSSAAIPTAGAWNGVSIGSYAIDLDTRFKNCIVEYGVNSLDISSASISVDSCILRKSSASSLVGSSGPFRSFVGNRLLESGNYAIELNSDAIRTIGAGNAFSGNTKQAIYVNTGAVVTTGTWLNHGVPYVLNTSISVGHSNRPVLTIAPGCSLKFGSGIGMSVGNSYSDGGLIAEGTSDSMIVFTSSASIPVAGAWDGITVGSYAIDVDTRFKNCVVEYGVNNFDITSASISVDSCITRKSSASSLVGSSSPFRSFVGNRFFESGDYAIELNADAIRTLGAGNVFSGNANQAINVSSSGVTSTGTWRNHGVPYVINTSISIGHSDRPILTIAPGCSLKFGSGIGMSVGNSYSDGGLIAEGTSDSMIVFTSSGASPVAGIWYGITVGSYAIDASIQFRYCRIEFGGGNAKGNIYCYSSSPTIQDCIISNSSTYGIYRQSSAPVMSGNTFSNNASGDLY